MGISLRFKKKIAKSKAKAKAKAKERESIPKDQPDSVKEVTTPPVQAKTSLIQDDTNSGDQSPEVNIKKEEPKPDPEVNNGNGRRSEEQRGNSTVHTKSISIKGILKGEKREVPVSESEIDELDQVSKQPVVNPEDIVVTEEDVQRVWTEYAEAVIANRRTYNALISNKPRLGASGRIVVEVATEAQQEYFTFKVKPGLTRRLQEKIGNIEYIFEIRLAESGDAPKKVYTDEDKLDYLMKKNPELEKMRNVFKLDFDS